MLTFGLPALPHFLQTGGLGAVQLEEYTGNPDMSGSACSGETRGGSEEVTLHVHGCEEGSLLLVCSLQQQAICVPWKEFAQEVRRGKKQFTTEACPRQSVLPTSAEWPCLHP